MRRLLGLTVLLALLSAGCVADQAAPLANAAQEAPRAFSDAVDVVAECPALRGVDCFEPTLAVDHEGRIFLTPGLGREMARSLDGGATFEAVPAPPLPPTAAPGALPGDNTLQVDAQGRLYYSAIVLSSVEVAGRPLMQQFTAGLHVARSDDGGDTWAANTYLGLNGLPPSAVFASDRQWLVFGEGDTVYLQYWRFMPGQAYVARSDDGGASFGPFVGAPGLIPGKGAVDADGRLLLPAWRSVNQGQGHEILLAVSSDRGATWTTLPVHRASGAIGHLLVSLAVGEDGSLHVAWREGSGAVLVATSGDGGATWAPPVAWTEAGAESPYAGPLAVANGDTLEVAWYEETPGGQRLVLARAPLADAAAGPVERTTVATLPGDSISSDFAWFTVDTDGLVHATWADHERGVRYARELPLA